MLAWFQVCVCWLGDYEEDSEVLGTVCMGDGDENAGWIQDLSVRCNFEWELDLMSLCGWKCSEDTVRCKQTINRKVQKIL